MAIWLARRRGTPARLGCADVVELVTDYFEGALPPRLADRVAAHLAGCDACTSYFEQMRQTALGLRGLELSGLSQQLCDELSRAFRDWPDPA